MQTMNQKHFELLNYFLKSPEQSFTYTSLAEQMGISARSVRNYISEVNYFLQKNDLAQIVTSPDKKLVLDNPEVTCQNITKALNALGLHQYALSREERIAAIYLLLISSPQITAQRIADELGISKKTLANDMKDVMLEFEKAGVLFYTNSRGYYTDIPEKFRRELIFHKLGSQLDLPNTGIAQTGLRTWIIQYFHLDIQDLIHPVVSAWLHDHQLELDGRQFTRFILFLTLSANRINSQFHIQPDQIQPQAISSETKLLACDLAQRIADALKMEIRPAEIDTVTDMMDRLIFPERNKGYWHGIDIHLIIRVFLTGLSQSLCMDLTDDTLLQEYLSRHIKDCLIRLTNGLVLVNHFKEELMANNPEISLAVRENISFLEKSFHCKFDEDSLAYIVLHIIASVERNYLALPVRACIVCNSGVASSIYLAERLQNYCKLDVLASLPAYKLQDYLETVSDKPDLIITVIPLPPQTIPMITISPSPTEKDISIIQAAINTVLQERQKTLFVRPAHEQSPSSMFSATFCSLPEIFSDHLILPDCYADTWQDALRQAGNLLVRAGHCTDKYVDEMIRNVEINGPYFVFFPGIALAHAAPPSPDTDFRASIIRLHTPVPFHHENNDPVYYVIAFVSSDKQENHDKLFSLINLFSDAHLLQSFINAETPKEFLRLFNSTAQSNH